MNVNGQAAGAQLERSATLQNAVSANGNGTTLTLAPSDDQITLKTTGASTPIFTVTFEVSWDNGSTWLNAFLEDLLNASVGTFINVLTNPSAAYHRYRVAPGVTSVRARIASYVSGTGTVTAVVRGRR